MIQIIIPNRQKPNIKESYKEYKETLKRFKRWH